MIREEAPRVVVVGSFTQQTHIVQLLQFLFSRADALKTDSYDYHVSRADNLRTSPNVVRQQPDKVHVRGWWLGHE
ncbi:hypothetical protein ACFX1Z_024314 [Malus domestica]